ncbi:MAG: hypothetical protein WBG86_11370, partial [Polyangiales bacterium]
QLSFSERAASDDFLGLAHDGATLVVGIVGHSARVFDFERGIEVSERGGLAVFERPHGAWVETEFLAVPSEDAESLGPILALDGDTLLASLGSPLDPGFAVFERRDGGWRRTETIRDIGCVFHAALDGDLAAFAEFCARGEPDEAAVLVHVYTRASGEWRWLQDLTGPPFNSERQVGPSATGTGLAIDGSTLAIGLPGYDIDDARRDVGLVVTYEWNGDRFIEEQAILPKGLPQEARFGDSLAISGDRLVIGAHGEAGFEGAVYTYRHHGGTWTLEQRLEGLELGGADGPPTFGWSVALRGSRLIVGAPFERGGGLGVDQTDETPWPDFAPGGAAYMFEHDGESWALQHLLKNGERRSGTYGTAVALGRGGEILVASGWDGEFGFGFVDVWTRVENAR